MKRLLLPLLAALALPTAANAESVWLLMYVGGKVEKIQMKDLSQCNQQGEKWKSSIPFPGVPKEAKIWTCLEGK